MPANAPTGYINIPLDPPTDGTTPAGQKYTYIPNDASIGDVDGNGEYEIILKWDPTNAHDNAHDGYTGNVFFDCYRLTGERLWRIDMGRNIRAGAHYTQFMVYDFDGDGRAEIIMKTSDGTIDVQGNIIGDASADYREPGDPTQPTGGDFAKEDPRGKPRQGDPLRNQGRILTGNEYLTVFNGLTGAAMKTIDYIPERGQLEDWGDNRANRSDRFLAAVAYLDGVHPSAVMCRGYYTRAVLAAFDWNGKELKQRWVFDSNTPGNEAYAGQGNHNLRVGDVDGDGCDEIIYGSCAIDNNGKGLYSTGMGGRLQPLGCSLPVCARGDQRVWSRITVCPDSLLRSASKHIRWLSTDFPIDVRKRCSLRLIVSTKSSTRFRSAPAWNGLPSMPEKSYTCSSPPRNRRTRRMRSSPSISP